MICLIAAIAAGCAKSAPVPPPFAYQLPTKYATTPEGYRTLVIYNKLADGSQALAEYYAVKRGLPPENIVRTAEVVDDGISPGELKNNLVGEISKKIAALKSINRRIDFIVMCKGLPIRCWEGMSLSVDDYISTLSGKFPTLPKDPPQEADLMKIVNPYFGKDEPFNSDKYGFYLVTRLDGYSFDDAKKLVDNSMAAKPSKGPFLLDSDPYRKTGGYKQLEDDLEQANDLMKAKGYSTIYDTGKSFVSGGQALAGYASWGSNDGGFNEDTYKQIKFQPGAIAETFVSTSARTFKPGTTGGQSLVADLIHNGVTGIKGYTNEPYAFALARPSILFDRYTKGYTLAESFYMASPFVHWRNLYIGDALCAPYKKK